tara:strand:- start:106 stop:789 length:684 start_codon:yes stop_codon:yes gene_type:complete
MAKFYSGINTSVGIGSETLDSMLVNGATYGISPSKDIDCGQVRVADELIVARDEGAPVNFTKGGIIIETPAYTEYQYTWSGFGDYTIDLTCGSYFHSEVIYVQHQTNGGSDMMNYARMKWANNHVTHTGYMYEFSGQGTNAAVTTTFRVSDQSGGGEFDPKNGLTAAGSPGASYRGQYGGGQESTSTTANGRLRISETYNGSGLSASTRSLTVKVYFGSFNITKTNN